MKIKDLVNIQGCYSAYDVGEKEIKEITAGELAEILEAEEIEHVYRYNRVQSSREIANAILSKYRVVER